MIVVYKDKQIIETVDAGLFLNIRHDGTLTIEKYTGVIVMAFPKGTWDKVIRDD